MCRYLDVYLVLKIRYNVDSFVYVEVIKLSVVKKVICHYVKSDPSAN